MRQTYPMPAIMTEANAIERVTENLSHDAATFCESLDRDDYSMLVQQFDELCRRMKTLDKSVPGHWNVNPPTYLRKR